MEKAKKSLRYRLVLVATEMSSVVANEWVDPHALDRLAVAMESVRFATSLGLPKVLPAGGAVASACKARFLDEGLQQYRALRVSGVPVLGQASADQVFQSRCSRHAPWIAASPIATVTTLANGTHCVQRRHNGP